MIYSMFRLKRESFIMKEIVIGVQEGLKEIWLTLLGGGIVSVIVGSIISLLHNSLQTKKKQKRATIALYEKYHSIEFYSKIRVSLWEIRLKWFSCTPHYKHYRRVVVEGWVGYCDHSYLSIPPMQKPRNAYEKCYIEHHVAVSEKTGLTEHQALTIGLEFWVTLNILRKQKLINKIDIFKSKYKYNLRFIRDFRHAVINAAQSRNTDIPSWVKETEELESYFKFKDAHDDF